MSGEAGVAGPDEVRAAFREWLEDAWDPQLALVAWRTRLMDSGWGSPSWPPEWYGRGLPAWADRVVSEELAATGAPGLAVGSGTALAAPTLLEHASDELRRLLLPGTLTGAFHWAQLFSEPSAGSDLAGLRTSAQLDGEEWRVDGQKVWNTGARSADYAILLARTDWDVPKHAGISYFVLPMHQPGVEVRPLLQMNRHSSFNEVFLTDARVPASHIVGRPGDGWRIARTTLAHERGFATLRRRSYDPAGGRAAAEAEAEAEQHFATYSWYPQRAGRPDLLLDAARASGMAADPAARQEIVRVLSMQRAHDWTARRAAAARALGRPPGPEGSLGKLAASAVARAAARVHARLAGAAGMLDGPASPLGGVVAEILVSYPGQSIAGGTDEIQRNIIGERVLGLPAEPATDRDQPFRTVGR